MYTDKSGNKWYKGNLHTHTSVSDGVLSPEAVLDLYKEKGYDFIALTDHWKWNFSSYGRDISVISGCEYDFGSNTKDGIYHIVATGCTNEPEICRNATPQQAIDAIHKAGGMACLAHPAWSLNTPHELMELKDVDMTEIFNSISDIPFNCRAYSGNLLDMMASKGCVWNLIAADDTHFYKKSDTCRSFIYVNAPSDKAEDITDAIRHRRYYASQGPVADIQFENGKLTIECSPVCEIVFYTGKVYTAKRCVHGDNITYAEYEMAPGDIFVRAELKDKDGNYAWTQYYTEE